MKSKVKVLLAEAARAALAAFVGVITAALSGCTTVNIPADLGRCSSLNAGFIQAK